MSINDDIQKMLNELKQKAQEFQQRVMQVEWSHEGKLAEIKNLEISIEKLKIEQKDNQQKASGVLQDATERAAIINKEAKRLLEEAQNAAQQAKLDKEEAIKLRLQGQSLMDQAIDKQKSADQVWHQLEAQKKKIKEAVGA